MCLDHFSCGLEASESPIGYRRCLLLIAGCILKWPESARSSTRRAGRAVQLDQVDAGLLDEPDRGADGAAGPLLERAIREVGAEQGPAYAPAHRLRHIVVEAFRIAAGLLKVTRQHQVLVLYSARRDSQIAKVGDRELPRILERDLPHSIDYYSEFMDVPRFQDSEYRRAFRDYLLLKYKGHHFDLIVAMSPGPL